MEEVSDNKRKLAITVPAKLCEQCFHKTVDTLRKDVVGDVRGWRADQVPLEIIMSRIGGQKNFKSAVIENILETSLEKAMKPQLSQRILDGSLEIVTDVKRLLASFDPRQPLTFEATYALMPPLEWLKPYKDIKIEVSDTGDLASDTLAAEDLLRQYRKQYAQQRVVAGRGVQKGDVVIMDLVARKKGGKLPLPGLSKDMFVFDTEVDPLGFTPPILGAAVGEERQFDFTFPTDYNVALWQNMAAEAQVKVHEVFEWVLPEFTDDFVKKHFPSFESTEDMRRNVISTTTMERLRDLDQGIQNKIVEAIAAITRIDLPDSVTRELGDAEYQQKLLGMLQQKLATPEEVEKLYTEEMVDDYIKKNRAQLEEQGRFLVAMEDIAERESIVVLQEELEEEVDKMKQNLEAEGLQYQMEVLEAKASEQLKAMKVMQWLQDNIKVEVKPWTCKTEVATS